MPHNSETPRRGKISRNGCGDCSHDSVDALDTQAQSLDNPAARHADDAWHVHVSILKAGTDDPALRLDPLWIMRHFDAFNHFVLAFEAMS